MAQGHGRLFAGTAADGAAEFVLAKCRRGGGAPLPAFRARPPAGGPTFTIVAVERHEWPFTLRLPLRFGVITVTEGCQAVGLLHPITAADQTTRIGDGLPETLRKCLPPTGTAIGS
jgi:hypothetical protein